MFPLFSGVRGPSVSAPFWCPNGGPSTPLVPPSMHLFHGGAGAQGRAGAARRRARRTRGARPGERRGGARRDEHDPRHYSVINVSFGDECVLRFPSRWCRSRLDGWKSGWWRNFIGKSWSRGASVFYTKAPDRPMTLRLLYAFAFNAHARSCYCRFRSGLQTNLYGPGAAIGILDQGTG